jgi:hypothetical protein
VGPVRLGEPQMLRDRYRNRVLRCAVADARRRAFERDRQGIGRQG